MDCIWIFFPFNFLLWHYLWPYVLGIDFYGYQVFKNFISIFVWLIFSVSFMKKNFMIFISQENIFRPQIFSNLFAFYIRLFCYTSLYNFFFFLNERNIRFLTKNFHIIRSDFIKFKINLLNILLLIISFTLCSSFLELIMSLSSNWNSNFIIQSLF
jgi:hypothetical protein